MGCERYSARTLSTTGELFAPGPTPLVGRDPIQCSKLDLVTASDRIRSSRSRLSPHLDLRSEPEIL